METKTTTTRQLAAELGITGQALHNRARARGLIAPGEKVRGEWDAEARAILAPSGRPGRPTRRTREESLRIVARAIRVALTDPDRFPAEAIGPELAAELRALLAEVEAFDPGGRP